MSSSQVELTSTLKELYSLDGGNSDDVALVYAFPNPTQLASSLPVSHKYAYQGPRTMKLSKDTMARFCLGCLAQYYGFIAGPMDLYLFDIDQTPPELAPVSNTSLAKSVPTHRSDAKRVFANLPEAQRPKLSFVEDAQTVAGVEKKKAVITPMDFLDGHGALVDQDAHWDLLSKRTLALSGLPSPPTEVIDSVLHADQTGDVAVLEKETERMLEGIASRALPFVVKLPMGLGGHAVFMVKKEEQRQSCLTILRAELPSMFESLTHENEAKKPVSLLVQDVVSGLSDGVSIFITKAGRPVYISTSEQILNERDEWSGGFMDYTRQEARGKQYHELIEKITGYVYQRGYYGPMGVDVMTDADGQQLIVDMNIRQTGSYTLGLMKKHFYEQRNLPLGGLICPIAVQGDRDHFEEKFAEEIHDGSLVIAAWCGSPRGMLGYSACGLLLGAKDREQMQALMAKVASMAVKK
ncbi:MAG: hypothetical protein LQ346_006457 [Caloplaca aetnensis]|nr:MAG: hypothetical protein LQ346_006457 [Caloplaca aetnensis]